MSRFCWCFLLTLLVVIATQSTAQGQPLVAESDPLTPEQQRAKFHLPDGFEIQLVASEPTIGQPMNLNFDAAGRLWATSSVEYPYPTAGPNVQDRDPRFGTPSPHPPQDWVMVFSGIGIDGKPAKASRFVEGLNIPIGIVPLPDGALVYSIPNIQRLTEAKGETKSESATSLYGPFGNVDTHGMTNSFTRWVDGWIYACHGFRNDSSVVGKDGHRVTINSGNTLRFREDGSRIEQWSHGQVNPFGMTFDPYGNLYNADCHSMPVTCVLRGGYYQSFGKPHDGLGFAPDMIDHNHGSTGICGVAWYAAPQFPSDFQENLFICNPVTGRVHRDKLQWTGSTPKVVSQPDFITCDDGWFRPVDVKLGPDGALYIADFYNAVIGHYEVPLQHPRRDRERGRIWRVVYVGATSTTDASLTATATTSTTVIAVPSLKNLSAAELIERLGDANFTTRTLATNEYVDRIGTAGVPAILELLRGESSPEQRANGLWIVSRLAGPESLPINTLVDDPSPMVRTHLARVLGEMPAWQMPQREATLKLLHDSQPIVQRAAADAIGRHPEMSQVRPLLQLLNNSPAGDTHLRHTLRMSLRDHLADDEIVRTVSSQLTEGERKMLAPLALGVRRMGAAAVELVADSLAVEPNIEQRLALSGYSVRYVARDRMEHVLHKIAQSTEVDLPLLRALQNSMRQRGDGSERELSPWAERLAVDLLSQPVTSRIRWHYETLDGKSDVESRFGIDRRRTADGAENVEFYCSFPRGENGTGVYRSEPFRMPETLSFYVVGHDGAPDQAAHGKNVVRLVANSSRATLLEVAAPRNDVAQRVEWKRPVSADEPVSIEIIDRNSSGSYAWIGAGRFSLESLNPQPVDPFTEGLALVSEFRIVAMREHLVTRLKDKSISINDRMACLRTLNSLSPEPRIAAMLSSRVSFPLSDTSIDQLTKGVVSGDIPAIDKLLEQTLRAGSATAQGALAYELAGSRIGASSLLSLVEQGVASRRLLLDAKLRDRLQAVGLPEVNERIAKLTEGLSPVSAEVANLLAARQLGFANWRTSYVSDLTDDKRELALMRGREVFKKTCAVCHQIGGEGAKIGPQLDGVGHRGFARILEDLIDPNRNVDAAFRSSTLVMTDGKVVTGLVRREEGATLVLADEKGKEFSVLLSEIELRKTSELSLMPEKLGESISEQDLYSLLLFLTQPTVTTPEVVP